MEKHITNTKALSSFVQLLDGSFPSGAFVHSFGLEPHIVLELVKDSLSLKKYLENIILDQYQNFEFVYAKKVFKLLKDEKLSLLLKEDKKYSAMLSFEYAKASSDMGANYLKHINFNIQKRIVEEYFLELSTNKVGGNEVFVLSAYAYDLGLSLEIFLLLWCKKNLINIASTALKISRIKPSEIQKLLFEFDEFLEEYIQSKAKNVSNFNPLFEEIIFQHKNLEPKMFVT